MFELKELRHWHEGNRLEAKSAEGGVPKSVWETYSAFANTNGGVILLGVSEDTHHNLIPTGLRDPERIAKNFWDTANDRKKVSANVLDEEDVSIEQVEDASIVVVHVPRADRESKPVYLNRNPIGGTYRRNGEGDYRCSEEEYHAMVRDNGNGTTALDQMPLEKFSLDDLDKGTINAYRNTMSAARPNHPWLTLDTDEFLLRLGASAKGEDSKPHPTRAGLLMFGKEWMITREFPYFFLDYREQLSGTSRWDHRIVSGDGEWSGNLYDFWLRVWQRLTQSVPRPFMVDTELRRVDDTPLHLALREALANTLIHADYYMRGNTVIVLQKDKITFANPGGLRIPADVAMAGGISDSRNPTLLKMFSLISIAERAGSGFDAMRAGCDWAGLPHPRLTESFDPDRTELAFTLKTVGNNSHALGKNKAKNPDTRKSAVDADIHTQQPSHFDGGFPAPISTAASTQIQKGSEQDAILAYLSAHNDITRVQAQQLIGSGPTKAKGILRKLVTDGVLLRIGKGATTRYTLSTSL